jgi:hypothetical protein
MTGGLGTNPHLPDTTGILGNCTALSNNDQLPEVHRLLAQSPKGRAYAILGSFAEERAYASDVPLTADGEFCLGSVTVLLLQMSANSVLCIEASWL